MPKPPLLPLIDWRGLYHAGLDYAAWLASGEHPENQARMETLRREQHLEPTVEGLLTALPRPVHVVAIAEDWCGDVVRHVPVLQRMAEASARLEVRFISRSTSLDAFARFLTNGGEAIPKFIFLNDQFVECGHWGPMPDACRELIARGKACGDVAGARKKVSALYDADPDRRVVVTELARLIEVAASTRP